MIAHRVFRKKERRIWVEIEMSQNPNAYMKYVFLLGYIVTFLITTILNKLSFATNKNPATLFCCLWCVVGFVSNLGIHEYYPPSDIVNVTIITGIITYSLFTMLFFNRFPKDNFSKLLIVGNDYVSVGLIVLTNIACLVFEYPLLVRSMQLISIYGMAYTRAFNAGVYGSVLRAQISEVFIKPIFTAITIITIIKSFDRDYKHKKLLIILTIADNVVLTIITAGRAPIVNAVFYLLITLVLVRGSRILNIIKKDKRKIVYLFLAAALIVVFSSMRIGNAIGIKEILDSIYVYYFSGPSYFSRLLENVTEYGIGGKLLFGQATFGFIINWGIVLLDPLFGGRLETSLNILGSTITSRQLLVGTHTLLNSMCTVFYDFIVDWGYCGIVLGPICLSLITSIIYKRYFKRPVLLNLVILIFFINVLIRTVFKWDMINTDFFVIYFFSKAVTSIHFKTKKT